MSYREVNHRLRPEDFPQVTVPGHRADVDWTMDATTRDTDIYGLMDRHIQEARSVVDQACEAALRSGTHGVRVTQEQDATKNLIWTVATLTTDVPFGQIEYEPLNLAGPLPSRFSR